MNKNGFTLIELIVTLCIFGILSMLVWPNYQTFIIKTRRAEGRAALMHLAIAMELYFNKHHTYEHAHPHLDAGIPKQWYKLEIVEQTPSRFALKAIPKKTQTNDMLCQTLTLNSLNKKSIAPGPRGIPTGKPADCW